MKTAISLPDDLFHRADALARREHKPRSQVYAEALRAWLLRREPAAVTAAIDEVEAACGRADVDDWTPLGTAALARSEWEP
jgi:predicted transcriptional regulator